MAWTLLATQDVDTYYRGGTSPAKIQTFSYDLGSSNTLYKTVTYFKDGEVSSTLASIPAGGGGLIDADYVRLLGRLGGQTVYGGTASGNNLQLYSTSNATKGKILFGSNSAYDETRDMFGAGTSSPSARFHSSGDRSMSSWTTNGLGFRADAATLTNTSSSGTVAAQVAHSIGIPTFAFSSATTITDAATLYLAGVPAAGTNATLTRPWPLFVAAGKSYFAEGANFGTTTQTATIRIASSMTNTNSAANAGYFSGAVNVTSAGGYQSASLTGDNTVTGNQNNTSSVGGVAVDAITRSSNTATVTSLIGVRAIGVFSTTGTITGLYCFRAAGSSNTGGGTITNLYGFYADDQTTGTNNFGIHLNVSSGSNKWNLYGNGTAANYLNGSLSIGTTTTGTAKLHLLSTTEQQRTAYDGSNYFSTTVSSTGLAQFDAAGTGAGFQFLDRVIIPTATPASASATGTAGHIAWDSSYIYICVATDTWKRVAIATWP